MDEAQLKGAMILGAFVCAVYVLASILHHRSQRKYWRTKKIEAEKQRDFYIQQAIEWNAIKNKNEQIRQTRQKD